MRRPCLVIAVATLLASCARAPQNAMSPTTRSTDSTALARMVTDYVTAARRRDRRELDNFSEDATFITTSSAYISGRQKLAAFYDNLVGTTDSIHYDVGTPVIRLLDAHNALVYFTWRVNWYRSGGRVSRLNDIGMMTVSAQKRNDRWLWVAITSQPFTTFFDKITDHQ